MNWVIKIKYLKKLFQINREKIYSVNKDDLLERKTKISCKVLFIDESNYTRVLDMRDDCIVEFKKMLQDGHLGVFAEVEGKIVSHAWLQICKDSRNKYNRAYGKLKDNEAIIHFCNTSTEYRGKGIYPLLLYKIGNIYFHKYPTGVLYISTKPNNNSSQKGLKKVGFKYLEDRLILRIFKYINIILKFNNVNNIA